MKYLLIFLIVLCCFLSCKENNTNPSKPVLKENRLIVGIKDTSISNRVIPMDSIPINRGVLFEIELAEKLDSGIAYINVYESHGDLIYIESNKGKNCSLFTFPQCNPHIREKYKVECYVGNPDSIFYGYKTFILY
jgi:hypothetical protein